MQKYSNLCLCLKRKNKNPNKCFCNLSFKKESLSSMLPASIFLAFMLLANNILKNQRKLRQTQEKMASGKGICKHTELSVGARKRMHDCSIFFPISKYCKTYRQLPPPILHQFPPDLYMVIKAFHSILRNVYSSCKWLTAVYLLPSSKYC